MTWTSCVCWVERNKRKEFEVYFSSKICIFLIRNQGFLRVLDCAGAAVPAIYWELARLWPSAELFILWTFLIFAASMWGKSEMKVLVAQLCPTLCDPMDCSPPGSSVHGKSSGKNTEVGCHALLQGIFSTQGSNPDLLHCRRILYCLSHQGSPHNLMERDSKYGTN